MTRVECNVLNFSSYEGTESVTQDQLFEISQSHLLKSFFLSLFKSFKKFFLSSSDLKFSKLIKSSNLLPVICIIIALEVAP